MQIGGAQLQPLTPTPPPLEEPPLQNGQMFRRCGPNLAPKQRGGGFTFAPCAQNAQNFMGNSWGISICMQNMKTFSDPCPPPLCSPPTLGCWDRTPHGAQFVFPKPHICVFKMISVTRGSFGGTYVGVPGTPAWHCCPLPRPSPRNPPPPFSVGQNVLRVSPSGAAPGHPP